MMLVSTKGVCGQWMLQHVYSRDGMDFSNRDGNCTMNTSYGYMMTRLLEVMM